MSAAFFMHTLLEITMNPENLRTVNYMDMLDHSQWVKACDIETQLIEEKRLLPALTSVFGLKVVRHGLASEADCPWCHRIVEPRTVLGVDMTLDPTGKRRLYADKGRWAYSSQPLAHCSASEGLVLTKCPTAKNLPTVCVCEYYTDNDRDYEAYFGFHHWGIETTCGRAFAIEGRGTWNLLHYLREDDPVVTLAKLQKLAQSP